MKIFLCIAIMFFGVCYGSGLDTIALGYPTEPDKPKKLSRAQVLQKGKSLHTRLQLGGSYTQLDLHPKGTSTYTGCLGGAQGALEYWASGHFYLAMTGNWRQGTVYQHEGRHRWVVYLDNQERIGIVLGKKKDGTSWTFFTGFGYRYLSQDFRNSASPRHHRYSEFYCPIGVAMEYTVGPWFIIDVNFTWMPQVYSQVRINSTKRSHYPLNKEIRNFSLEIPFDFPLMRNQRLHFLVIPFGEYWRDGGRKGKTKSGDSFKIRQTNYNYWGIDLNLALYF